MKCATVMGARVHMQNAQNEVAVQQTRQLHAVPFDSMRRRLINTDTSILTTITAQHQYHHCRHNASAQQPLTGILYACRGRRGKGVGCLSCRILQISKRYVICIACVIGCVPFNMSCLPTIPAESTCSRISFHACTKLLPGQVPII